MPQSNPFHTSSMLTHRAWRAASLPSVRSLHQSTSLAATPSDKPLTGAAKLFQDAIEEESSGATPAKSSSLTREHLRLTQGPIWDGDESTPDAVLRMLVDAHKPLRSGEGIKHNAADEKIKGWMKGLKLEPRLPGSAADVEIEDPVIEAEAVNPHKTTLPPHLHRPWHATYTGETQQEEAPKIKFGMFIKTKADSDLSLLELRLPPNADAKTRSKVRSLRKAGKMVKRVENAREGALDYKLGLGPGEGGQLIEEMEFEDDDETFSGNRQTRGASVLGAQKGGASGLKAWAGLVEERIQRAKGESGLSCRR